MYKAKIEITLRPSILDPQGKATRHALHNLGYSGISDVRIGKMIELAIDAASGEEAHGIASEACEKLLANSVMENFAIEIEEVEAVAGS